MEMFLPLVSSATFSTQNIQLSQSIPLVLLQGLINGETEPARITIKQDPDNDNNVLMYSANGQVVFGFGFDGTDQAMDAAGWSRTNQSNKKITTKTQARKDENAIRVCS